MSPCSSSGVSIMTRSAHLAPSATSNTLKPAASAFLAEAEPLRNAIATSLTPESFRFSACMTLAAIADDEDLLALDQVQVRVAIVINTHGFVSFSAKPKSAIQWAFAMGQPAGREFPGLSRAFPLGLERAFLHDARHQPSMKTG